MAQKCEFLKTYRLVTRCTLNAAWLWRIFGILKLVRVQCEVHYSSPLRNTRCGHRLYRPFHRSNHSHKRNFWRIFDFTSYRVRWPDYERVYIGLMKTKISSFKVVQLWVVHRLAHHVTHSKSENASQEVNLARYLWSFPLRSLIIKRVIVLSDSSTCMDNANRLIAHNLTLYS